MTNCGPPVGPLFFANADHIHDRESVSAVSAALLRCHSFARAPCYGFPNRSSNQSFGINPGGSVADGGWKSGTSPFATLNGPTSASFFHPPPLRPPFA